MTAKIHPFQHPADLPRSKDGAFRLGRWLVQPDRNTLSDSASEIRLHPKAMEVLVALAERSPDVVPRDLLIRNVWGGAFVGEEVLTSNIQELRKALGDNAKHPRVIETVPKRGYRLMVAVTSPASEVERIPEGVMLPARRIPFGVYPVVIGVVGAVALGFWLARRDVGEVLRPASTTSFSQLTTDSGEESFPSISPDGQFVVYSRKTRGYWNIYRQRLGGQTAFNLTDDMTADAIQPSFSPDGKRIAFRSERDGGGIFIMGATGESLQRVTDFGFDPAWSPDGTRLVVSTLRFLNPYLAERGPGVQLQIVDVATGETHVAIEGRALQPSWSPSGDRIAFWGIERDIWTIPADGGSMVRVTDDRQRWRNWNPVWSPDGRYLYFASDRGGSMNLWRIPVEETSDRARGAPESITTPARVIGNFSMSRNVQTIIFTSIAAEANVFELGFDPDSELVHGEPTPITQGSRLFVAPQPSPDGESLVAWTAIPDEGISIVSQDGRNVRKLPVAPGARFPRRSPDGAQIVFNARSTPESRLDAWTIGADGDGLRRVTDSSSQPIIVEYPFWSPDGTRIVVGANDAVHIFSVGNGNRRDEASFESLPIKGDRGAGFSPFSWSPDGAWLAGNFEQDGERGIGVLFLSTGALTRLTDFGQFPVWFADSRRVLFSAGEPMAHTLFLADRETGASHEIFAPEGASAHTPSMSKDNRTIFYTHRMRQSDIWSLSLDPAN